VLALDRNGAISFRNPVATAVFEKLGLPTDPGALAPTDLSETLRQLARGQTAEFYRKPGCAMPSSAVILTYCHSSTHRGQSPPSRHSRDNRPSPWKRCQPRLDN
jgi:hypothetical protein